MSIASMVAAGVKRQEEQNTASAATASNEPNKDTAMDKVTKFIPSEVIAIYVAALGILAPVENTGKWWIYFACLALTPILIAINYQQEINKKTRDKAENTASTANTPRSSRGFWRSRIPYLLALFALIAFTAWVCALPETPFLVFTPLAVKIGAVAILVLAVVMGPLAEIWGLLPKRS